MAGWALLGFEGFRLIGRRTYCFYAWSFLSLVGGSAALVAGVAFLGALHFDFNTATPLQRAAAILTAVVPLLGFASVLTATVYRSVLEPDSQKWAYLRLGPAEGRMLLFTVAVGLVWVAITLAFFAAGPWMLLANLAAVALWSRFSLIGPAVFLSGGGLREGWRLGAGQWRGLLVMALVAWATCSVAVMGVQLVWRVWAAAVYQGDPRAFLADPGRFGFQLARGFVPVAMAYTAISVVALAPAAAAYRKLAAPDSEAKRAEAA